MPQSNENPEEILNTIKAQLKLSVTDRHHGFHTPVFTNINNNNEIFSRTVVLRNFDDNKFIISFHTDYRSIKIKDILNKPQTYFVFYDFKTKIQLRIKTQSLIEYNNNFALLAWQKTKLSSRKCYLTEKAPSSKTNLAEDGIPSHLIGKDPDKEASEAGYKNFALVNNKINSIEWLYLSYTGHRRLRIDINGKKIEYQWLIP